LFFLFGWNGGEFLGATSELQSKNTTKQHKTHTPYYIQTGDSLALANGSRPNTGVIYSRMNANSLMHYMNHLQSISNQVQIDFRV
jgi:hypothetical protein